MGDRVNLIVRALVISSLLLAFNQGFAQDYPHAFPRLGVTQLLENERVFIWEVIWPNGEPQPYHRHQYDMTGVFLRWGPLRVTRLDGSYTDSLEPFEIPNVFFLEKGVTHKEEGIGMPERHSIMIDIKEYSIPASARLGDGNTKIESGVGVQLLENERLIVNRIELGTGQSLAPHYHGEDSVLIFLSQGALGLIGDDGSQELKGMMRKDVWYLPRGQLHSLEAVGGPADVMLYKLK